MAGTKTAIAKSTVTNATAMRQYLERIAPVRNLKDTSAPLLIVHGKLDKRVPVSESEQIIAAAKLEGLEVWSLLIKNEGHGFADLRTRDFVFLTELVFIQRHLSQRRAYQFQKPSR